MISAGEIVHQITPELLDFCRENYLFINLKTGVVHSERFAPKDTKGQYSTILVDTLFDLCASGRYYPGDCYDVFCFRNINYLTQNLFKADRFPYVNFSRIYHDRVMDNRRKGCLLKYGVDNPRKHPEIASKIKSTNIERYGVDHPMKNPDLIAKAKNTCFSRYGEWAVTSDKFKGARERTKIERYGTIHPLQNSAIKAKMRQTLEDKYGGVGFASRIIKDKIYNTMQIKYGDCIPMKVDSLRDKIFYTNNHRYGAKFPLQSSDILQKTLKTQRVKYGGWMFSNSDVRKRIAETNIMKYGTAYPTQTDEVKAKTKQTNILKYGVTNPMKLLDVKIKMLTSRDGLIGRRFEIISKFRDGSEKPTAVEILRIYPGSQGGVYLNEFNLRENKRTKPEIIVEDMLLNMSLDYEYRAMSSHGLRYENGRLFEIDFLVPKLKLGIEVNGVFNHSPDGRNKNHSIYQHKYKFLKCRQHGITLLTFTDWEIYHYPEFVRSVIEYHVNGDKFDVDKLLDREFYMMMGESFNVENSCNYCLSSRFKEAVDFTDPLIIKYPDGRYYDCGCIK